MIARLVSVVCVLNVNLAWLCASRSVMTSNKADKLGVTTEHVFVGESVDAPSC